MFAAILVVFTVFAGQLLRIQAFDASATQAAAFNKRLVQTLTPAMRGQILDTNGQVLADSVERYTDRGQPQGHPGLQGAGSTARSSRSASPARPRRSRRCST